MTAEQETLDESRMTLGEHLEELRKRLLRSAIVLAVCFGLGWYFKEALVEVVMEPWRTAVAKVNADLRLEAEAALAADPSLPRTKFFTSAEPGQGELIDKLPTRLAMFEVGGGFFFALNVAVWFAIFAAAPFILWEIWAFVAVGLYRHEKRAVLRYFPFSVLLFVAGVVFCYRYVVPVGTYFLSIVLPPEQVVPVLGAREYFSFLSTLCLAMGCVFQLPLLMLFLSKIGLVDPRTYGKYRRHFLLVALVVAAIVTPGPDWASQLLMTAPMLVLYEVGILLAKAAVRRQQAEAA